MLNSIGLTGDELNRRLNTIATNAVREAQIAIGRFDKPWIDDDWRRANMIAQILQLAQITEIDPTREHYPLTSSVQAPANPRLDNIEKKLADALMGVDEPEVELKLPPLAQNVSKKVA